MKKVTIVMRVAVHPIKAEMWKRRAEITPDMTLREIGKLIGVKEPQQVKHHLQAMVTMGSIDYVGGQYVFPRAQAPKGKR